METQEQTLQKLTNARSAISGTTLVTLYIEASKSM
jgi:hypothetical protein